jgi:Zn-dependent peptidase ImmA (M78 family)/DNA-binding XRE family transcriptional regulator
MTKRVNATVKPDVLEWARTSAAYTVEAAAAKIGVDEEALAAWEAGNSAPSIAQLRKLAEVYKRPLAVLYLPERPTTFKPMHDFRRLPDVGLRSYSPELTYEIRLAHQRRQLALELFQEDGERLPQFTLKTTLDTAADAAGQAIREALGVTFDLQSKWRDTRAAFIAWRNRIEELGVLVFQASRVESSEASGFAYWADALPFIVVNRKDAPGRRLFSLLHELAHLMLHQSGVSDLEPDGHRPADDERVEVFCNKVAASALMPRLQFLSQPEIAGAPDGRRDWSDDDIEALARTFSVSREAVVRRLLTLGRTTDAFYRRKRAQYAQEYNAMRQREKEKRGKEGIPRNMPRETVANFGQPLVRMLLSRYQSDKLSLAELSGFLGVKVRHVPGIERQLGLG